MLKFKQILFSQRGAALIMSAAMLLVVVISIGGALTNHLRTMNQDLNRVRARISSIQMMQDFAVMAAKANDVYRQLLPLGSACPAGKSQLPTAGTSPFCFDNPLNAQCITSPRGVQLCLAPATSGLSVAALRLVPGHESWSQFAEAVKEVARNQWLQVLAEFSGTAEAQVASPWLPAVAGAPTATLDDKCVAAGPPDDLVYCKICTDASGNAVVVNGRNSNVDCLTLQVCTNTGGVCNAAQLYTQRMGFIPRN